MISIGRIISEVRTYCDKESRIPPPGHLLVFSHEFHMDVGLFIGTVLVLSPDRTTVV